MTVRVRLFAILRERAGSKAVEIELAEGATVADALAELRGPTPLGELLDRLPIRMAVNRDYAEPGTRLAAGDERVERERLDYEAYREMAERRIAEILAACVARHGLEAAAAEHRIGAVPLGEARLIVAAAAAHRAEAFAGARDAIDRIKAEAPIWKRELGGDGVSRWVAGAPPR